MVLADGGGEAGIDVKGPLRGSPSPGFLGYDGNRADGVQGILEHYLAFEFRGQR